MSDALRKLQGQRLKAARTAAGYRSAREAALENSWPESTYRAHEAGTRTIGQDDAERYAKRFRAAGAQTSAREILFGDTTDQAERDRRFQEFKELWWQLFDDDREVVLNVTRQLADRATAVRKDKE